MFFTILEQLKVILLIKDLYGFSYPYKKADNPVKNRLSALHNSEH